MNKRKMGIGLACLIGGILLCLLAPTMIGSVLYPLLFLGGIAAGIVGIIQLIRALAKPKASAAPAGIHAEGDDGLNAKITAMKRMRSTFLILAVVMGAILILPALMDSTIPAGLGFLLIFGIVAMVACYALWSSKIKAFVSDNIVRAALERVFDEVVYTPGKHIPEQYVRSAGMGLPAFERIEGDDHVIGQYKGLNIEMSDIRLIVDEVTVDEEGNESHSDRAVFSGLWLVCDFGKKLSADMRLWDWGGLRITERGIITDNEEFNRRFRVESDIPVEAFYILTPHMMEYILSVREKSGGALHMCFTREGKVQIAIDSGRDAFEVGKKTDAALLREQFVGEIRFVTDIIDELRLVNTLYV